MIILYSSLTGNTKKVAEYLAKKLKNNGIYNIDNLDPSKIEKEDKIIFCAWNYTGIFNKEAQEFIDKIKDKNIYFVGTMGSNPNSDHGEKSLEKAKNFIEKQNHYLGGVYILGKITVDEAERGKEKELFSEKFYNIWLKSQDHPNQEDLDFVLKKVKKELKL